MHDDNYDEDEMTEACTKHTRTICTAALLEGSAPRDKTPSKGRLIPGRCSAVVKQVRTGGRGPSRPHTDKHSPRSVPLSLNEGRVRLRASPQVRFLGKKDP